jgi:hypothetical protein
MSGVFKAIGKVFKAVVKVAKKVLPIALSVGAVVLTGGAALGLLPPMLPWLRPAPRARRLPLRPLAGCLALRHRWLRRRRALPR